MIINKEMLVDSYKLSRLERYNHRFRVHDESVAEHSYFVTLFSLMICEKLHSSNKIKRMCLEKALLHDLPEIVTSDIPHDVKEMFPDIRIMLNRFEHDFLEKYFDCVNVQWDEDYANNDLITTLIVDLADVYSVYQFCHVETSLGNSTISDVFSSCITRISVIEKELRNFCDERGFLCL